MMKKIKKKIILITFHFPPDAAVGAVRQKEHAELLAERGWDVHVVTVKEKYYEKISSEIVSPHPNIHIHRTAYCQSPLKMVLKIKSMFSGKGREAQETIEPFAVPGQFKHSGVLKKLKQFIIDLNSFPDEMMMWCFPAVVCAVSLVIKHRIGIVYVSSPPHVLNLIGVIVKLMTKVKLVIEHRDPWTTIDFSDEAFTRTKVAKFLDNKIELLALARADAVVTTTSRYRDFLHEHVKLPIEKIICVYNGFNNNAFSDISGKAYEKADERKKISYFGNFYFGRNPFAFLKSVSELAKDGMVHPGNLTVELVGVNASTRAGAMLISDVILDLGIGSLVTLVPWVDRIEAIRRMQESDVLLLFQPETWKMQIPAKIFEYLPLRKPILGLVGDGASADVIRECDAGIVVEQNDVPAIKTAILQFLQCSLSESFYRNDQVETYSRMNQVTNLERFLASRFLI